MMSSGTSTDASTLRPWHFFALAALIAATVGVWLTRNSSPASLVLLSLTIGAGALTGLGLYRTLWPLTVGDFTEVTEMVGERTRAAVGREKTLVLRSIKELEFDRAMGKVSEKDFDEMSGRLRARALNLMKQLDFQMPGYRGLIERELEGRLKQAVDSQQSMVDDPRAASTGSRVQRRSARCWSCFWQRTDMRRMWDIERSRCALLSRVVEVLCYKGEWGE